MNITVVWDNDVQTALRLDFEAGWNWRMFREAVRQCAEMMWNAGQKVNIILNLSGTRFLPEAATVHARNALAVAPENLGYIVVVTTSIEIESAFSVIARVDRLIGERLVTVPTVEAARAALAHPYTLKINVSPASLGKS